MKVCVTGATGHIGGVLVRGLLEKGFDVRAMVFQPGPALEGLDVAQVPGDVRDVESLARAFDGCEIVFHLAAVIVLDDDPENLTQTINVAGTRNVVEACRVCGVRRLVHFSSVHALSPYPEEEVVREDRALADLDSVPIYDRSKARAEQVVLDAVGEGLDAVIVNPTGVIGPYDFEVSPMGKMIRDLMAGHIPALVPGGFNWVDVRDLAATVIAAAERGVSAERYIVGGHWHSLQAVAEQVAAAGGAPAPRFGFPLFLAHALLPFRKLVKRLGGDLGYTPASLYALRHHRNIDWSKAQEALGHAPRPFEQTIEETVAWIRETEAPGGA